MKRRIWYPVVLVLIGLVSLGFSDKEKKSSKDKTASGELVWYRYDKGLQKAKAEKKPILVDFYTDWCGWCKKMDRDTYANQEIIKVLNDNFIAVKLNAESRNPLEIKDEDGNKKTEAQIAREFKVTGYPITWFLRPSGEQIAPLPGYRGPADFLPILSLVSNFVKEKAYEKMTINEYIQKKENSKVKKN